MAVSLSQYWKAWTKVMPFIPPLAMPSVTTRPSTTTPIQYGPADGHLQGEPGALQLGQQVEAADEQDHDRGGPAQGGRVQPPLGEIGDGVGAEAPQRCGHGGQQHQVAGGVADGVPEGAEAFEHGQARRCRGRRRPRGTRRRWLMR